MPYSLPYASPSTTSPFYPHSRFHFNDNDDDSTPSASEDENDDDEEEDERHLLQPPLKLNPNSSMHMNLTIHLPHRPKAPHRPTGVPFPRSSPLSGPGSPLTTPSSGSQLFSPPPSSPVVAVPSSAGAAGPVRPFGVRPVVARASSSPVILLSNGKPLKSSLKSSPSAPSISNHTRSNSHLGLPAAQAASHQHQHQRRLQSLSESRSPNHLHPMHTRAASAPTSPDGAYEEEASSTVTETDHEAPPPALTIHCPPLSASSSSESVPGTPGTPKNVHFARNLSSVKLFNRRGKPASLLANDEDEEDAGDSSAAVGDDTEDDDGGFGFGYGYGRRRRFSTASPQGAFPFPKFLPSSSDTSSSNTTGEKSKTTSYALAPAPGSTSHIPAPFPSPHANVHLEAVALTPKSSDSTSPAPSTSPVPASGSLCLTGSVLVRNLAFAKDVAVRFTLDEWRTTSEVTARYVDSVDELPRDWFGASSASSSSTQDSSSSSTYHPSCNWDRFAFSINLDDHSHALHERTLWMVARFAIESQGSHGHHHHGSHSHSSHGHGGSGREEWWDNNCGRNYRVGFVVTPEEDTVEEGAAEGARSRPSSVGSGVTVNVNVNGFRSRARGLSAPPAPIPNKPLPPLTMPQHQPYTPPSSTSGSAPMTRLRSMKPAAQISIPGYTPAAPAPAALDTTPASYSPVVVQKKEQSPEELEAFRRAANQTTSERLKRLSLRNYARPAVGGISTAGSGSTAAASAPVVPAAPATTLTSSSTSPPFASFAGKAVEQDTSDDEDEEELRTPDLVDSEGRDNAPAVDTKTQEQPKPVAPAKEESKTTPQEELNKILTPNLSAVTTESAYEAFLRQWCFASTGASSSSSSPSVVPFTSGSAMPSTSSSSFSMSSLSLTS